MSSRDKSPSSDEERTPADEAVYTKYKTAGDVVNRVLSKVIALCVANASCRTISETSDMMIEEETGKVFKKEKDIRKGIAFPSCLSVNNCICHFCPMPSDPDYVLQDGDVVKIDLGAHIDGFIALVAHTLVVGASKDNKVTGRKADVILAAYNATEAAYKMIRSGNDNTSVSAAVQKVSESFNCKPVEGMLTHQLLQDTIDGEKVILLNPSEQQKKELKKDVFENYEVYGVDILVSSGEGKTKEKDTRTTIYKRTETVYSLKMKASRAFFSEVCHKYNMMPFSLRFCEEESKARVAVKECLGHSLLKPYPVLWEKEGEYVAQFKYTVIITRNGPVRITHSPFDAEAYQSEHTVLDEALKALILTEAKKKKKSSSKGAASSQVVTDIKPDVGASS